MMALPLLSCCAPFTLTAGVILFTLSAFMQHRNWTFEVLAAKEGWSLEEKSACCRNAAIFYVILSTVLWVALGLTHLSGKKARKEHRGEFLPATTVAVEDTAGDGGDNSDRMGYRRHREEAPLLQRSAL
ncbi:hypothetical protein TraAM80_05409 [Trypanosoma rangeli]|uniref:Uncharacterized protein n=1 Tax=Trypanosoma rangeli TaxID=5698 RepID=A0A3R7NBS0_TRYRA|nr:uncharacterized protein TraAM80_05409 [Trypanosoma rangeli]RNF03955.1 hypothetical protein TraAM80_05409 [Trypanosoma rangeli]|eukprot:RNF03955.1 hypothetical protein TraAM80_05409 [Trypanosoma rangeli]